MEEGISQIAAKMSFNSNGESELAEFDLFLFMNSDDYICYVEAVNLLYKQGTRKECDFRD